MDFVLYATCAAISLAVLAWNLATDRKLTLDMRALHGTSGRTRPWTGSNGRSYCFDLAAGKIVRA